MKKRFFTGLFAVICLMFSLTLFTACGSVVPCAWVYLKMDGGYITYSSDMYGNAGDHVHYYLNEEDATSTANSVLSIRFSPRILGADTVKIDDVDTRTTTVDISDYADMSIIIKTTSSIYAESKKIYLNGEELEPTQTTSSATIVCYLFQNVKFVRGNPNGHINGAVNSIEYK